MKLELTEDQNLVKSAFSWLLDKNLVLTQPILNVLHFNLKFGHEHAKYVKEISFVVDDPKKKLLVYVDLQCWFFKKRKQLAYYNWAIDNINKVLPNYQTLITFNSVEFNNLISKIKG